MRIVWNISRSDIRAVKEIVNKHEKHPMLRDRMRRNLSNSKQTVSLPRFVGLAEKIEYAGALRGVAVSAIIQEAVAARADQVIEAESRWLQTREEAAPPVAMTDDPPKPTAKEEKAASCPTGADWKLDPPANTRLLTNPFAGPDWREKANLGAGAKALRRKGSL